MTHYSRNELERYFSGEKKPPQVGVHLESCNQCRDLIVEMHREQESLLQLEPAAQFAAAVVKSAKKVPPKKDPFFSVVRRPALVWSLAATLLLCGVGYFFFDKFDTAQPSSATTEPGMRWKGATPVIEVFVNRQNKVVVSKDEVVLRGDQVQYRVTVPEGQTGYAALVAIEGKEVLSIFPPDPLGVPLAVTGSSELPGSVLIEKDTKDLSLLLILKNRPFKIDELLNEMNNAIEENRSVKNFEGVVSLRRTAKATP